MIIPVYKEEGPTSRDVLNTIQKLTGEKKVGHGGTLDPLAKGVLIVAIGRESTKKLHNDSFYEKEYRATIFLGEESITDDREGEKKKISGKKPSKREVEDVLAGFLKEKYQIPPAFSAIKVKGKESYKVARKGVFLNLEPKKIEIKKIEVKKYSYPFLEINVITGSGVYIRSIARDIGKKLKTGAYLYSLIRTRVGSYCIDDCVKVSFFKNKKLC